MMTGELIWAIALSFVVGEGVIFVIVLLMKVGDGDRPGSFAWWQDMGIGMLSINGLVLAFAAIVAIIYALIMAWVAVLT
jgi:hypothetical protein